MRIIAGERRGRALVGPRRGDVRPTGAYLREAVFNVLAPRIGEARILDLFAGTGAMGLEALSRGAAAATFVDRHAAALEANVARLGFRERSIIVRGDALRALSRLGKEGARFEVIYADPPYDAFLVGRTVAAVAAAGVLAREGVFLVEHHHKDPAPERAGTLARRRDLRHGETTVTIYAQTSGQAGP